MHRFPSLTRRPGNGQQFIIANASQTNIRQRGGQAYIFTKLINLLDKLRRSIGEHKHCQRAKRNLFPMPVFVRGGQYRQTVMNGVRRRQPTAFKTEPG
ncbi:Uncharacterised protein [Salmonella enterica subsp. enterica serovar Bovismorbificans]|uniref:Uncharacterized protein n=1 Tax=Salmonella enterica subsp. enterica serovar Bovismorbificans TaxID=58097 RepID=A0A655DZ83_SALET|nr:Uncharacterised protein [Salmonella enterica subsp. enterica serovar Bovismorbificans]CPR44551.1 Uncharacterised protein [Salmonella enterica subsp. enterica serovar Bovismorbificans]